MAFWKNSKSNRDFWEEWEEKNKGKATASNAKFVDWISPKSPTPKSATKYIPRQYPKSLYPSAEVKRLPSGPKLPDKYEVKKAPTQTRPTKYTYKTTPQVKKYTPDVSMVPKSVQSTRQQLTPSKLYGDPVKGFAYGAGKLAQGALGAIEGISDFASAGINTALGGITSLGGRAPNPVSDAFARAAEYSLENDWTARFGDWLDRTLLPSESLKRVASVNQVAGNILPGAIAGAVAPVANAGLAAMSLSAAGRSASDAYNAMGERDHRLNRALTYGALSGIGEAAIESLAGGIPGMGEGVTNRVINRLASNDQVRRAVSNVFDVAGEGVEEALSEIVNPVLMRIAYNDPSIPMAEAEDIATAAIMGAVTSGAFKGTLGLTNLVDSYLAKRRVNPIPTTTPRPYQTAAMRGDIVDTNVIEGEGWAASVPPASYRPNFSVPISQRFPGPSFTDQTLSAPGPMQGPATSAPLYRPANFYAGPRGIGLTAEEAAPYLALPSGLDVRPRGVVSEKVTENRMFEPDDLFDDSYLGEFDEYLESLAFQQEVGGPDAVRAYRDLLQNRVNQINAEKEAVVQAYADYIYGYEPQGVSIIQKEGDLTGYRVSNNEPWYSKYAGRKLSKVDARGLAEDVVEKGNYGDFPYLFDPAYLSSLTNRVRQSREMASFLERAMPEGVDVLGVDYLPGNSFNVRYGTASRPIQGEDVAFPINAIRDVPPSPPTGIVPVTFSAPSVYFQNIMPGMIAQQARPITAQPTQAVERVSTPTATQVAPEAMRPSQAQQEATRANIPDPVVDVDAALAWLETAGPNDVAQIQSMIDRANQFKDGPLRISMQHFAERAQSKLADLVKKYGAIKPGENPARQVQVPKQTADNNRVSQFARTVMEAGATPDSMISDFENEISKGTFSYIPISDKSAQSYADSIFKREGTEGALLRWQSVVDGNKTATKDDIVLGERLYMEAAKSGDAKTAMKLAAEIAAEGTRAGQSVQAIRLLKKMTPEGQLYYIKKSVDNLNNDLMKRKVGRPSEPISINEQLAQKLLDSKNQSEIDSAVGEILQDVADQVPSRWTDKWNAWRYLAMLGNPRTHIRNIIGNAVFYPARLIKNEIGAAMELPLKKGTRTKSLLPASKDTKKFASEDFELVYDEITGGGKLNPSDMIRERQTVFKSKPLEAFRKWNSRAMDAEDMVFLKQAYSSALGRYMKANGYSPDFLKSGTGEANAALERGRNIAIKEAQKATYRDASKFAEQLNRLQKTSVPASVVLGGLIPFTKTPINVLKRGVEYSPAGVLKGAYDMATKVRNGEMTAAEGLDELAAGLTGTGIVALGYWLSSMGWIKGALGEGREGEQEKQMGEQMYSLTLGDKSYTIDWAAPITLPLFVGVELQKSMERKSDDPASLSRFMDAMTKVSDPMFNLSMLDGINSAIKSFAFSENPISSIALDTVTSYATQAVPTVAGQIARTVDPVRRTTYAPKDSELTKFGQTTINKVKSKIPGLSTSLEPYVDKWGQQEVSESLPMRVFENFISPGYIQERNPTAVDKEVMRVYQQTGEVSSLPRSASTYMTKDGETLYLQPGELTKYQTTMGQTAYKTLDSLIKTSQYRKLPDEEKAEIIAEVYSYAGEKAKKQFNDSRGLDGTYNTLEAVEKRGGIKEYLSYKMAKNGSQGITGADGEYLKETSDSFSYDGETYNLTGAEFTKAEDIQNKTIKQNSSQMRRSGRWYGLTKEKQKKADEILHDIAYETAKESILNARGVDYSGVSSDVQYFSSVAEYAIAKAAVSGVQGKKGANGKTISGSKKAAAINELQKIGYSYAEAAEIYKLFSR